MSSFGFFSSSLAEAANASRSSCIQGNLNQTQYIYETRCLTLLDQTHHQQTEKRKTADQQQRNKLAADQPIYMSADQELTYQPISVSAT